MSAHKISETAQILPSSVVPNRELKKKPVPLATITSDRHTYSINLTNTLGS